MFTSRAEFRLSLRADNADQRLTTRGRSIGCVGDGRWEKYSEKMREIEAAKDKLTRLSLSSREISGLGVKLNADGPRRTALEALALADFGFAQLAQLDQDVYQIPTNIQDQVKRDALYAHYIARQERDVAAMERDESQIIPDDINYASIKGLSNEVVAKLSMVRPGTIAHAGRIEGMTPAALMLIIGATKKQKKASGA